jgi:hypothetical protein
MNGCTAATNGTSNCNGHNLGVQVSAGGSTSSCGGGTVTPANLTNQPAVSDSNYRSLASNIPSSLNCIAPSTSTDKKGKVTSFYNIANSPAFTPSGASAYCGHDVTLTEDVTVPAGTNGVLIIQDGSLDLGGHTLSTASGASLTIVFTSASADGSGGNHFMPSDGNLNIEAPNAASGSVWHGVAVYQDPKMTKNVDWSASGNSPSWEVSGLMYMPNATLDFAGSVDKNGASQSTYGAACSVLVVNVFKTNGTALSLDETGCGTYNLAPPSGASVRTALVQ